MSFQSSHVLVEMGDPSNKTLIIPTIEAFSQDQSLIDFVPKLVEIVEEPLEDPPYLCVFHCFILSLDI